MREIELRAYDIINKKMTYLGNLKKLDFKDNFRKKLEDFYMICGDANLIKFMLWTGRLDKNGKKIYGGDIIKSVYENKEETGEVFYDTQSASFDIKGDNWMSMENLQESNQYYEIIGNIYENKERLKQ